MEFTESEFHSFDQPFLFKKRLGDRFIGAVDCRTRKKIGKDHVLKNNDVIKILTSR
ncbi:MAG: hypothetical protein DRO62_03880 [Candidatus Altiarchaeales archaeon]|nr:MAG: hypothetical protein DRO62_03880 [Candidatus Altiarchaeales archaeon]